MSRNLIKGTKKDDMFGGTPFDDVIIGGAGNDSIWGYGGDDEIGDTAEVDIKRKFDDSYFGGGGKDILTTYSGNDILKGGAGDDFVFSHNDDSFKANGGSGFDVFIIDDTHEDFHQEFRPYGQVTLTRHDGTQTIELKYFEQILFTKDEADWSDWL